MKRTAIVTASLLCLTAGAAFAGGDGDGPYGPPDTAASLPPGFYNGTVNYQDEMRAYRAAGLQTPPPADASPYFTDHQDAKAVLSQPTP